MMRSLRFSILSISVWMVVILFLDSFSHAIGDDDQDGAPNQRRNNTNIGRLPLGTPPFLGFQQSQFGLPFQTGAGFPFNSAMFQQQNGFPQQNGFQQNGFQQNTFQQNGLPQQNSFQQQSGFPQNGFQQGGFPQNTFQQNSFVQDGFQQLNNLPQQQNGVLVGQGSQFNSIGLQNQLMRAQLGLGNQFGGNGIQNQLALQNQLSQNPFGLMGVLQQNQLGLQNQLALKNQLGFQNQLGMQNPFVLQNQLGFQNQLGQNPFSLVQQLGSSGLNNDVNSSQFGLGNPQLGFTGQSNFGLGSIPQNNGGFGGSSIGTGSLSSLGNNQFLLSGGQFQDTSSSLNSQFGSANRFPFGTSLNNNRFPSSNNNGLGGSQFAGSQFSNQFSSDPFLSQRPQHSSFSSHDNRQQLERPFRNGGLSPNDRALSFNDTFDSNAGLQAQRQQPQQQPINPFLSQQVFGSFNRQPMVGNSLSSFEQQWPQQFDSSPLNQQQQLVGGGSSFPSSFNQHFLQQQQQQPSSLGESSLFQNRPMAQFNNIHNGPFKNQGFGPNSSLKDVSGNHASDQLQSVNGLNHFPSSQKQQQQLPIPATGFSCDGRPPGYYADVVNGCRTFHICVDDGSSSGLKRSFACPNGTFFDQANTVCQWKEDMDCSKSHLFYPRPVASATTTTFTSNSGEIRPTTPSPFNTQIPSPVNNNFPTTISPSSFLFSGIGQPSPAAGSLDAGRSLQDTRRNTDDSGIRPTRNLYSPPQIRPSLFRPSERLDDTRRA